MALSKGLQIASYEILSAIGADGRGGEETPTTDRLAHIYRTTEKWRITPMLHVVVVINALSNVDEFHSHRMRCTFAVDQILRGTSIEDVAEMLGNTPEVCARHCAPLAKQRRERLGIHCKVCEWRKNDQESTCRTHVDVGRFSVCDRTI
jgi:hypothetical protein